MINIDDLRGHKIESVKHVRTGQIFHIAYCKNKIFNATSSAGIQEMVLYANEDVTMEFVREINEFCDGRFVVHEYVD